MLVFGGGVDAAGGLVGLLVAGGLLLVLPGVCVGLEDVDCAGDCVGSFETTGSVGSLSSVPETVGVSISGVDVDSLTDADGDPSVGIAVFSEQAVSASRVRIIISNTAFFMALSSD